MLAESVSQCSIKFWMQSVMVCLKGNVQWRNYISFKKDSCVVASERLNTNYCQIHGWTNFVHVSIMQEKSFWGAQSIVHEKDSVPILQKGKNWKFYISLKGNKLACFANT